LAIRSGSLSRSYVKTAVACTVAVAVALLITLLALALLPRFVGPIVAAFCAFAALVAATLACASAVVLARYRRAQQGKRDLFLVLNRSCEPDAIRAAAPSNVSRMRRWLVRRLFDDDLVVGDLVEIKPWAEIRATLDERGCLDELPFMPEMVRMCGRRARVFRRMHRLFDYRKTRRMRHMDGAVLLVGIVCDGSRHGECEAACHTLWKSAWLRRIEAGRDEAGTQRPDGSSEASAAAAEPHFGTTAPRYICQLTQLHAASKPIDGWSTVRHLLPVISGNVAPAAFAVGWLTHLFNELQHLRQGVGFPAFETVSVAGRLEEAPLRQGDKVVVRSAAEIRATLNDQFMHRGLWFEPDMMKHCRHRYEVQAEVRKLIDIVTGEMLVMKTPAYILRGVHFSGERQLFNSQYEPLFWRSIWLRRVTD
jgi:hypothetical protein